MRDIFSEGLLYLDLLELYGSSYAVAELCGVAQSNVFRGASACSKLLNLGLTKDRSKGEYRVERNHDVQRDLRRLNQRLRARENGNLRVLGPDFAFPDAPSRTEAALFRRLPCRWDDSLRSLDFLEQGLLDLVLMGSSAAAPRVSWPAGVRRRDLYVPVSPFLVSELCELPLVLLAVPGHPVFEPPLADLSVLLPHPCLCSEFFAPEPEATRLAPLCPPLLSSKLEPQGSAEAFLLSNPECVVVLTHQELLSWRDALHSSALCAAPLAGVAPQQLLMITQPALVKEPLHQELSAFLHRISHDRTHAAETSLGLDRLHSPSPGPAA